MKIAYFAGAASALLLAAGAASAQDWQGFYIGGHAGGSFLSDDDDERLVFDTDQDGDFDDTVNTTAPADAFSPGFCGGAPNGNNADAGCTDDDNGVEYGVRGGYDWQMGSWVVGALAEYSSNDLEDNVTGFSTTPASYAFRRELDSVMAVRARVGYATPEGILTYVTGGWARGDLQSTFTTSNAANSFTPTSESYDADGYQVGAGVEKWFGSNFSVGLEYIYTDLEDDRATVRVGPGTAPPTNPFLIVDPTGTDTRRSDDSFNFHALRLTAGYRF